MITFYSKPKKNLNTAYFEDFKTLHFAKNVKAYNKFFLFNNAAYDAFSAYNKNLAAYITMYNLQYVPEAFAYPFGFFYYYNNSIHYFYNKAFSISDNIKIFFSDFLHLPCSPDLKLETALLDSLKKVLKMYSRLSKAEKSILAYEQKHNAFFPFDQFFVLENTICFRYFEYNFQKYMPCCDKL